MHPDAEALRRLCDQPEAFVALYERHHAAVHNYLRRRLGVDVADDLAAETFARALRARSRYRPQSDTARPWQEVMRPAPGRSSVVERYSPATGRITVDRGAQMVPGEIFHAASCGGEEPSPAGHRVVMALWVDAETYAPLRFTDRGQGRNLDGAYDQTFTETVTGFERLPDTPENRRLLEMQAG